MTHVKFKYETRTAGNLAACTWVKGFEKSEIDFFLSGKHHCFNFRWGKRLIGILLPQSVPALCSGGVKRLAYRRYSRGLSGAHLGADSRGSPGWQRCRGWPRPSPLTTPLSPGSHFPPGGGPTRRAPRPIGWQRRGGAVTRRLSIGPRGCRSGRGRGLARRLPAGALRSQLRSGGGGWWRWPWALRSCCSWRSSGPRLPSPDTSRCVGGARGQRAGIPRGHSMRGREASGLGVSWLVWSHLEIVQPLRDLPGWWVRVFGKTVSLRPLIWVGAPSYWDACGCFFRDVTSAFLARGQEWPASDGSRSVEDRGPLEGRSLEKNLG